MSGPIMSEDEMRGALLDGIAALECTYEEKCNWLYQFSTEVSFGYTRLFKDRSLYDDMFRALTRRCGPVSVDESTAGCASQVRYDDTVEDVIDRMWHMAVDDRPWVQPVCDEVVFGRGSSDLSNFEFCSEDTGYSLVCDSSVAGVNGYGVVVRRAEVIGIFPVFVGDKDAADAFRRCMRVAEDGAYVFALFTALGPMSVDYLRAKPVWKPTDARDVHVRGPGRFRKKMPDGCRENSLFGRDDLVMPDKYSYLEAVQPRYMVRAVLACGLYPAPRVLLEFFERYPEAERVGCVLQQRDGSFYGVLYIGGTLSLVDVLARLGRSGTVGREKELEEVRAMSARGDAGVLGFGSCVVDDEMGAEEMPGHVVVSSGRSCGSGLCAFGGSDTAMRVVTLGSDSGTNSKGGGATVPAAVLSPVWRRHLEFGFTCVGGVSVDGFRREGLYDDGYEDEVSVAIGRRDDGIGVEEGAVSDRLFVNHPCRFGLSGLVRSMSVVDLLRTVPGFYRGLSRSVGGRCLRGAGSVCYGTLRGKHGLRVFGTGDGAVSGVVLNLPCVQVVRLFVGTHATGLFPLDFRGDRRGWCETRSRCEFCGKGNLVHVSGAGAYCRRVVGVFKIQVVEESCGFVMDMIDLG